jgi:enoyl-[acyl-carrier protein] reductase II
MTTDSGGPAPNRVCEVARIDIPIIQAPMTYIAGAQLAAAVSNAGALGIIETTSDQDRADLRRVRDLTDGSVGANIALIMNRDPDGVDLLVANDIRFVTTSAGDPSFFTDRLHDMAAAFVLGAEGVQMGTRLLASTGYQ